MHEECVELSHNTFNISLKLEDVLLKGGPLETEWLKTGSLSIQRDAKGG